MLIDNCVSRLTACATALLIYAGSAQLSAQSTVTYPAASNVINVTQAPYNADRTGQIDATAAIQRAVDSSEAKRGRVGWVSPIVYLPNGTYRVSNTIRWKNPPYTIGPHMQGQNRKATVIKLADNTWPLGTEGKAVLHTGDGVAQNFNKGIHNLTVLVGRNNAGAKGIYFYGNNEALLSDVDIISLAGSGLIGLDLGIEEQGPAGVRNLYVRGFDVGIQGQARSSVTLSRVVLENQRQYGIVNLHYALYVDSLVSTNRVPVVMNRSDGIMVVIDAYLNGGSPSNAAIINDESAKMLFVRNIRASGYQRAVWNGAGPRESPSGLHVSEYVSYQPVSLFTSPQRSLNLPRKYPPEPVWETDMNKWVVLDTTGRTAAQALQAAIDDPTKTTICLPCCGNFYIDRPIRLRGNIKLIASVGGALRPTTDSARIVFENGTAPVVKLVNLSQNSFDLPLNIYHRSSRTLILESLTVGDFYHEGTGDLFITDCVSPLVVNNPSAHAYAWHFDAEGSSGYMLDVLAGTAWIFGWKDEGMGTPVRMTGGVAELIGFVNRSSCAGVKPDTLPQFVLSNASFSVACATQSNYCDNYYDLLVREARGGQTRELRTTANPYRHDMGLFTAYDTSYVPGIGKRAAPRSSFEVQSLGETVKITCRQTPSGRISLVNFRGQTVVSRIHDGGRASAQMTLSPGESGAGVYCVAVNSDHGKRFGRVAICR